MDDTSAPPSNLCRSCMSPHYPGALSGLLPTPCLSHEQRAVQEEQALLVSRAPGDTKLSC